MITKLLKRLQILFWLLPGFLLYASFPPMGEKTDIVFALAPLLWVARRDEVKKATRTWFLAGLVFWVGTLAWMPAIVKNGGPWPLVVLGWGALAAYCALYFAAFGFLAAKFWHWANRGECGEAPAYWKRLVGLVIVEPILWAGLELVRSRFGGGFAWNQLGVAAVNAGFGAPAALGGVYLLSALVVLVNGTITSIAERMLEPILPLKRKAPDGFPVAPLAVPRWARSVETFLPLFLVWAVFKLPSFISCPSSIAFHSSSLSVALVQRDFPCVFKPQSERPLDVYKRLLANVSPLKPDLVVLPESAMCEISEDEYFAAFVLHSTGANALLSGTSRSDGTNLFNSVALYEPNPSSLLERIEYSALRTQYYDKVHLVPFGEYIPGDKIVKALQKLAPVGSCTPGEPKLLELENGVKLGVAICYEDTDSALVGKLTAMGADALVFVTNDAWFSNSDETVSHAWQAVARAIETGLPVIRVGNSGVTGVVTPDGETNWLADAKGRPLVDREGTMFERVAVGAKGRTFYNIVGDIPLFVAFVLLLLVGFFGKVLKREGEDFTLNVKDFPKMK